MEMQPITDDITVVRDERQRAVLVRGRESATVIDFPSNTDTADALLQECCRISPYGLRTAILTHEPEGGNIPFERMPGVKLIRADRPPASIETDKGVPSDLVRYTLGSVHVVSDRATIEDDAGRRFLLEPCVGPPRSLAVFIEPEKMLVVCADLHPHLPPRAHPGTMRETLVRLRDWRARAPEVLVPASGIPIAGEQVIETLDASILYLEGLYRRVWTGMTESRYPWERLIYTIPWCDLWQAQRATPALVELHHANIRSLAEDVCRECIREAPQLQMAA